MQDAKKSIEDEKKVIADKDKEDSAIGKNPFVMIGVGIASGAMLAANLIAPGIGLLGVTILFTQVFHVF